MRHHDVFWPPTLLWPSTARNKLAAVGGLPTNSNSVKGDWAKPFLNSFLLSLLLLLLRQCFLPKGD